MIICRFTRNSAADHEGNTNDEEDESDAEGAGDKSACCEVNSHATAAARYASQLTPPTSGHHKGEESVAQASEFPNKIELCAQLHLDLIDCSR